MSNPATRIPQLCPTCSKGQCPYRDGIYCRNFVCALKSGNEIGGGVKGLMTLFEGLRRQADNVARIIR